MSRSPASRPQPPASPRAGSPGDQATSYRPQALWGWALLLSLAVFIPWIYRQLPELDRRPEYLMRLGEIELRPAPEAPVPSNLLERLERQYPTRSEVSVVQEGTAETVARLLATQPWIEAIERVDVGHPKRIVAQVKYRAPVAMVRVKQGVYPIAAKGVLLPPQDFSQADIARYPRIENIGTIPDGAAGTPWNDAGVQAGALLAEVLLPHWQELQLDAIVAPTLTSASTPPKRLTLSLLTNDGSRIVFGHPPGSDEPGELTIDQKLGRLRQYLVDYGNYNSPHGPYEIDIRPWREMTRRPLEVSEPAAKSTASKGSKGTRQTASPRQRSTR